MCKFSRRHMCTLSQSSVCQGRDLPQSGWASSGYTTYRLPELHQETAFCKIEFPEAGIVASGDHPRLLRIYPPLKFRELAYYGSWAKFFVVPRGQKKERRGAGGKRTNMLNSRHVFAKYVTFPNLYY